MMTSTRFLAEDQLDTSINAQDVQNSGSSMSDFDHSSHSYDGLPRSFRDQTYCSPTLNNFTVNGGFFLPSAPFPLSPMDWTDLQACSTNFSPHESYFDLSSGTTNQGMLSQPAKNGSTCPRTWPELYDPRLAMSFHAEAAPSEYLVEPTRESCPTLIDEGSTHDIFCGNGSQDFSQLSISRSPTMESQLTYASPSAFEYKPAIDTDTPSSPVSEAGDDEVGGESVAGSEERVADEPYAKLIYRALLSRPSHSMVLQEIYQWFKDNTDKGNSGTSGWRNSIRHNLSMNAAFRKTDRRPSGDETKKTSEWVLEPFAIKDGITPTTRYRVKSSKKTISGTPSQRRIESGRKGGLSVGKRNSQRLRDDYEATHSMHRDRRRHRMTPMTQSRHLSPSTPPGVEMPTSSPYFANPSPFSFGGVDVKGVYNDGPAFYNSENPQYGDPQSYSMWPQFSQC